MHASLPCSTNYHGKASLSTVTKDKDMVNIITSVLQFGCLVSIVTPKAWLIVHAGQILGGIGHCPPAPLLSLPCCEGLKYIQSTKISNI